MSGVCVHGSARGATLMGALLLLAGCAGVIPEALREGVDRGMTFADLRANPEAYNGRRVAFGGEILKTTVQEQVTEIEVLHYPLRYDDSPDLFAPSGGRFLVRRSGFLDPAVYAAGRLVTVVGIVQGSMQRQVGEVPYRYPAIGAEYLYLWPRYEVVYPPGPYYAPYAPWPPWPQYPYYRYRHNPYWPYGWGPPYWW